MSSLSNVTSTNHTTGVINATTGITSGTLRVTGLSSLTNVTSTNHTTGVINATTGITTGTINVTGLSTLTNASATNISSGAFRGSNMVLQQQGETILLQGGNLRPGGLETVYNGVNFGCDIRMDCNNTFSNAPNYDRGSQGGTFYISNINPLFRWDARGPGQTNGSTIMTLFSNGNLSVSGVNITGSGNTLRFTTGSTTLGLYQDFNNGNGARGIIGLDGSNYAGFNTGALLISTWSNNPVIFATNQTQRMTITTGGNVGVGTTNPAQALHVNGNALIGHSTGGNLIFMNTNTYINSASDYLRIVSGNGTSSVVVPFNGNVGIGTTSPSSRLHVHEASGTLPGGNAGSIILSHGNTGGSSSITFLSANNPGSDCGFIQYIDSVANPGFTGYNYFGSTSNEAGALLLGSENDGNNGSGPDSIIISPVGNVAITPRNNVTYISGNVGINTTSPSNVFHAVANTSSDAITIENINATGYASTVYKTPTRSWFLGAGSASSPGYPDRFYLAVGGGGSAMILNTAGHMGLAGQNPSFNGITLPTGGCGIHWVSGVSRIYDDGDLRICTDDNMRFHIGSNASSPGTERMTINSIGNVGINTTSPGYRLDVNGIGRFSSGVSGAYGLGNGFNMFGSGTHTKVLDAQFVNSQDTLSFYTPGNNGGGTAKMVIQHNGNVGIGTTTPLNTLHVVSNAVSDGITIDNTLTNGYAQSVYKTTSRSWFLGAGGPSTSITTYQDRFYLLAGGNAAIIINTGGNIGLGGQSPGFNGITVQNNGSGIHWTNGASRILDDGNLRICTDDTIHFHIGSNSSQLGTERMTIGGSGLNYNGVFRVSADSDVYTYFGSGLVGGTGDARINVQDRANNFISFYVSTSKRGGITVNGGGVAYNTSSDYRVKENIVQLTDALARVNQLSVKRFNFIDYPGQTVDGFIAHEVASVVPEAITGTKDAVDGDGNPVLQSIDQSKLVPLLTSAVQEIDSELQTAKSTISSLQTDLAQANERISTLEYQMSSIIQQLNLTI